MSAREFTPSRPARASTRPQPGFAPLRALLPTERTIRAWFARLSKAYCRHLAERVEQTTRRGLANID